MHQTDLVGQGRGGQWLQRARTRLLDSLVKHLDAELRAQTCIVFDAKQAPQGGSWRLTYQQIQLLYARQYQEADDLLEELIAKASTPRNLMVVSSDHRLQTAAKRRRCKFSDSEVWYDRLVQGDVRLAIKREPNDNRSLPEEAKPKPLQDRAETAAWLEAFGFGLERPAGEVLSNAGEPTPPACSDPPRSGASPIGDVQKLPQQSLEDDLSSASTHPPKVSQRERKPAKRQPQPTRATSAIQRRSRDPQLRSNTAKPKKRPKRKAGDRQGLPEQSSRNPNRQLRSDQIFPPGYGEDLLE